MHRGSRPWGTQEDSAPDTSRRASRASCESPVRDARQKAKGPGYSLGKNAEDGEVGGLDCVDVVVVGGGKKRRNRPVSTPAIPNCTVNFSGLGADWRGVS